ncbi:MAG TPA: methyltransferase domain-containing protein [Sphingobium sp.]
MQGTRAAKTERKVEIGAAFGAAAGHYDASATVQRDVAAHLAAMASRERLPQGAQILEIGCGTGLLTQDIRARWPAATLIATDIAPDMLAIADRRGAASQLLAMDGEAPVFEGRWFDLILSSLAFQWFDDMGAALARLHGLLRPGASLYFATMGAESFASWRAAHEACGLSAGIADYPTLAALQTMLAPYADAFACDEHYPLPEPGGTALVRHFRGIGAQLPRDGYRPLGPAAMRRVIAAFDAAGGQTSYHVLYGRITNAA